MRDAETVHDVAGLDTRPHDDPELRQLRTNRGELDCQGPLLGVERARLVEQGRALGVERRELTPAVWHAAVALRIFGGNHSTPLRPRHRRGSKNPTLTLTTRRRRCGP
jgi:hypothetical protein